MYYIVYSAVTKRYYIKKDEMFVGRVQGYPSREVAEKFRLKLTLRDA